MFKFFKHQSHKAGLAPGTMVHVGESKDHNVSVSTIAYDSERIVEPDGQDFETIKEYAKDEKYVCWININGIHNTDIVKEIGSSLNLHPLVMEDMVNSGQRPKLEEFENLLYFAIKSLNYNEEHKEVESEHISILVSPGLVLSIHEHEDFIFKPVHERLAGKTRTRFLHVDYLAYALIDFLVDGYFRVLETIGVKIEQLEDELSSSPTSETIDSIYSLRKNLLIIQNTILPLKELLSSMLNLDNELIHEQTLPFIRDVQDHLQSVQDTISLFRDIVTGLHDSYHSVVDERMNSVMKVLTIIATLFIPLTFLAGIYGMNFRYFPELELTWGYPAFWVVSLVITLLMVIFFKKKGWF